MKARLGTYKQKGNACKRSDREDGERMRDSGVNIILSLSQEEEKYYIFWGNFLNFTQDSDSVQFLEARSGDFAVV